MTDLKRRDFVKGLLGVFIATQIPFEPRIWRDPLKLEAANRPPEAWQVAMHLVGGEDGGWFWMPGVTADGSVYSGSVMLRSAPFEATRTIQLDGVRVYSYGTLFHQEIPLRNYLAGLCLVAGDTVTYEQRVGISAA